MNTMPVPDPNTIDDSFLGFLGLSRAEYRDVHSAAQLREESAPGVGERAPDFTAERLDPGGQRTGVEVCLSDQRGRPVALIFGSYTCPPFRGAIPRLVDIYTRYGGDVEFFFIYIQEAHPEDGWQMDTNRAEGIVFSQPSTDSDRAEIASVCIDHFDIPIPVLLDTVSNDIDRLYAAVPSKLYLIDPNGDVAFGSGPGPWEFDIDAWERAIRFMTGPDDAA